MLKEDTTRLKMSLERQLESTAANGYIIVYYAKWQHKYIHGKIRKDIKKL